MSLKTQPHRLPALHLPRPRFHGRPRNVTLAAYAGGAAGVAVITWLISLLPARLHVSNISMVYLVLILVLAALAGSGPAIAASFLSVLAFDWFFVAPVGQVAVTEVNELLALVLFLGVAIITGQLAAALRNRAEEARQRERETATLYELSTAILGDAQLDRVLDAIVTRLVATLGLRSAAIFLKNADGRLELAAEAGEPLDPLAAAVRLDDAALALRAAPVPAGGDRVRRSHRDGGPALQPRARRNGREHVPVVLGGRLLGVLSAEPRTESAATDEARQRLLHAFAAQVALAVGRTLLAQEEERARAAAASERLKTTFLASVSHDLRTPITVIRTAAAGLNQEIERQSPALRRELVASIDREADRLNRLVDNLLEMSRIEGGGLQLNAAPEDLAEIVGTAVHRFRPLLGSRRLTVRSPDQLPPLPLDAPQIERVLGNLLDNAIKFSPPDSEIVLDLWAEREHVCLRLMNAAAPLSAEERTHLFDKFYRLPTRADRATGTGLGLAICKGIVEAHGGNIVAEEVHEGVSFLLTLPLPAPATAPVEVRRP